MSRFPNRVGDRKSGWITIASLAIAYLSANYFDIYLKKYKEYAGTTFDFRPSILISSAAPLVNVAVILALAWLVVIYLPPRRFPAILFIISGFFVVAEYLSIFVGFPIWLRSTIVGKFRFQLMDFGPQSSTYYLGVACLIIGTAALLRAAKERRQPASPDGGI